jgi:hypothetical protein
MLSAGGYGVSLASGSFELVRVQITLRSTAAIGSNKKATVTASWTGDGTLSDVVRSVVKVIA